MTRLKISVVAVGGWVALALASGAVGAESPNSDLQAPVSPSVSAAGAKRIQENLVILDQNIKDAESNLVATQKNLKTLESEIDDLSGLEKENIELRQKYRDYVSEAEAEMAKNRDAIKKIEKYEQELKAKGKSDSTQAELEKARREREERDRWISDAQQKTKHARELLREVQENLTQIEGRRQALKNQLSSWAERHQEYEKLLSHFKGKKAQLEKLARK